MSTASVEAAGPRVLTIRGRASGRVPVRLVLVSGMLLAGTLTAALLGLMLGEVFFTPGEVVRALVGGGSRTSELFVVEWRLPRVLCAAAFGAMLGVSGALFQTITRNPLGSPDIIGFSAGAHMGGVLVMVVLGSGFYLVAGGAILGGLGVAAVIFLFTRRDLRGFRLIIVGIAVSAMVSSIDTWLILTADLDLAIVASAWGVGSLNGVTMGYAGPSVVLGALVLLAAVAISRPMRQLELGDDHATALGTSPGRTRLFGVLVGVTLVAVATSVAGPIAFVALAAPQIGRRLARTAGTPLLPAALTGALVLSVADLIGQYAIPDLVLPVGVVTVAVGGVYLLALVVAESRKGAL